MINLNLLLNFWLFSASAFTFLVLLIIINNILFSKPIRFKSNIFSKSRYYVFLTPFMAGLVLSSVMGGVLDLVFLFLIFGISGIIGETLFSIAWQSLYSEPFWEYKVQTILNGYTSYLNFIPWSVGGITYITILEFFQQEITLEQNLRLILCSIMVLTGLILAFKFLRLNKFKRASLINYSVFVTPLILMFVIITFYNSSFTVVILIAGLVAFIFEYTFGKVIEVFAGKSLWDYNFWSFDKKHISLLSILPFTAAGLWFNLFYLLAEGIV